MKKILTSLIAILSLSFTFANPLTTILRNLDWEENPYVYEEEIYNGLKVWQFEGAVYDEMHPSLPYYSERFPLNSFGQINVTFLNTQFEDFNKEVSPDDVLLAENVKIFTEIEKDRGQYFARVYFIPIRKTGPQSFERLVAFELNINHTPQPEPFSNARGGTFNSVLEEGDIYKIAVSETGMHKLDFNFLKNELGIPLENIDPRNIKLYGNGGGMLPELAGEERYDDLVENAIEIIGEGDGNFDSNDYLLFYAEGADKWYFDEENSKFNRPKNIYETKNYYYIKISSSNGLRISSQISEPGSTYTATTFNDYIRLEDELENLLHDWNHGQGSGRHWYGDYYKLKTDYNYDSEFETENIVVDAPAILDASLVARIESGTGQGAGKFDVTINDNNFVSSNFSTTGLGPTDTYAYPQYLTEGFIPNNNTFSVTVNFQNPGGQNDEAWLDYVQINFKRHLQLSGDQMDFRDLETLNHEISSFKLSQANNNTTVWDISNPQQVKRQELTVAGSDLTFGVNTTELKEFIAFNSNGSLMQAEAIGQIENQNIHGINDVDLVIIYHNDFKEQADRLAQHRAEHSGIAIAMVEIGQLYNEFSSGKVDAAAVRDFAKMLYERGDRFKSLLLFGDGSYDARNINGGGTHFIPVFETHQSLNPISAFPSDDFYTLLDDTEGSNIASGSMDIGIGRIPVKTLDEAKTVVDKIIKYDTAEGTLGDWRNRVVFVGDDGDSERHTKDANIIADKIAAKNPNLNIDKIYLDAYPQVSTPFGTRVPLATEALNKDIFKGTLAVTYLGHGGAKGWTQERILKLTDIAEWENEDRLPLFITATCSFAGYDDAAFTTAGEELILKKEGGAIGLFTTVRAVYASANKTLTEDVVDTLFFKINNQIPTLGEVLRISKNESGANPTNSRKFTLLGDPSMQLALPNYNIATTKINGIDVATGAIDTIRALSKVTIEGEIRDDAGNLINDFNGIVFPTFFDKEIIYQTLGHSENDPINYKLQKNIIFKGRASVNNGKFEFTFVVPKDIDYNFGAGKISYYASDLSLMTDATGFFRDFIIGGTDPDALADEEGPDVNVFMNTENFVFGGITDENPILLVKLQDDNGINVVGNSIGHDLAGELDMDSKNTFILNDFYEAALDDHTAGEARFPLSNLEEGLHEIEVTAWDVCNNVAKGRTEFLVVTSEEMALNHVLNYPNPFTTNTCFMFEHNQGLQEIDVLVQIYTVSGRLVKTLEERVYSGGYNISRDNCLQWDGRDDFGDPLAKGIYLYKLKVKSVNTGDITLKGESDFEKLVILK